jgi:ribosomal protein S6
MSETKKLYEVGYLLISTLSDEQVAEAAKAVRDVVESNGGSVTKEEAPKFKRLAYSMRKKIDTKYHDFDTAYFGYIIFESEATAVGSIESAVGALAPVLRRLVVKDPVLDRLVDADAVEEEDERPVAADVEEVSDEELDKSIDKAVGEADEAELKSE